MPGLQHYRFCPGNALATGLPGEHYDIALERALIHHLKSTDLRVYFVEAFRLLTYIQEQLREREGQAIVEQDRWTIWSGRKGRTMHSTEGAKHA